MKLRRGAELSKGKVLYWLQGFCIECVPSHDGRWHVGHFDREEFESLRENTIALLKDDEFHFMLKVGKGFSVKARCVSANGTFVFSVHRDPDATMAAIIAVDAYQNEIFRVSTTTHLTSCALSEFSEYLALSFSGSHDKEDPYRNRLEVYNLKTGEVISSMDKGTDLLYAEVVVTEPDGNVVAFFKGKTFKVC